MSKMGEVWRLIPYHVGSTEEHFRATDALVRTVRVPTIWWHSTDQPTLILGAGQQWTKNDLRRCAEEGVRVVKRQSGGTAVLALPDVLGLDIALPTGHRLLGSDVVEGYRWLGEIWLAAVRQLGAEGRLVSVEEARASSPSPDFQEIRLACFGTLSPYEVAVGGRKLVGLAQVRRQGGVLFQSALHLHFEATRLAHLLPVKSNELAARLESFATGLNGEIQAPVQVSDVIQAFDQSLREAYAIEWQVGDWSDIGMARDSVSSGMA